MRADRLLALLMLLQSRGPMTAAALARDLEVSERTIYRDMEALGMAGVPAYAERGPGGGCRLMEGWRSDLTGLTAGELSALVALDIPAPLAQLGMGTAWRQALLKLLAAGAPADGRAPAEGRPRLYIDPAPWSEAEQVPVPLLDTVYRTLLDGRQLRVARGGPRGEPLWLVLHPYGLVSKAGRWYLLAGSGAHTVTYRVDHLLAAEPLEALAQVPAGLDLKARWEQAWRTLLAERRPYPVRLRVSTTLAGPLQRQFPAQAAALATALEGAVEGWFTVELPFGSLEDARARILPWGGAAKVLAPAPLAASVADYARQAAALYEAGG